MNRRTFLHLLALLPFVRLPRLPEVAVTDVASGVGAAIGGGASNTASGDYSAIAGGLTNDAIGSYATTTSGQFVFDEVNGLTFPADTSLRKTPTSARIVRLRGLSFFERLLEVIK